ncbi:MAG: hypothetical protein ACLRXB_01250 [Escherichia coli]
MKELFIISYSVPEMPDCEPEKRLTWLQVRFRKRRFGTDARACWRYNLPAIRITMLMPTSTVIMWRRYA